MVRYLTVPDLVWMNLRVTGSRQDYDFARLEEAVFLQYSHGPAEPVDVRANRFLGGFAEMRPFRKGNRACAALAFLTFCEANGLEPNLGDASFDVWVKGALDGGTVSLSAGEDHLSHGSMQDIATNLLETHHGLSEALVKEEPAMNLVS